MFQSVIKRLAKNSLKMNKCRNIFVILTIALSTCFITSMVLIAKGYTQSRMNKVANQYQAYYQNVSDSTIMSMKKDAQFESIGEYCTISTAKFKKYIISRYYIDNNALKMTDMSLKGSLPESLNDIAVEKSYLSKFNIKAKIGDDITIDIGDGKKTYHITGIVNGESNNKNANYPIICSYKYLESNVKNFNRIVLIRIADSENMSSKILEDKVYNAAKQYNIDRSNVKENIDYFDIHQDTSQSQLLVYIIIAAIILFAAAIVIYSIFYIFVTGRVVDYGRLRTIGATKKQIKKLVSREGIYLSSAGLSIGLIISCVIAYFVIPKGWNAKTTAIVCIIAAIFIFMTVMFSIRKPIKIASNISPIEAVRYSSASLDFRKVSTSKLHRRLTPLNLARINFLRSKKKSILTLLSLSLSGIILMCGASFMNSLSMEKGARGDNFKYGDFQVSINSNSSDESDDYAPNRIQQNNPLNQNLENKILDIDGVTGIKTDYSANVDFINPNGKSDGNYVSGFSKKDEAEINSMLKEGNCSYAAMNAKNGIIITACDSLKRNWGKKPLVGDKFTLEFYTAKGILKKEYKVYGIMDRIFGTGGIFLMPDESLKNVTNTNCASQISIAVNPKKKNSVKNALKSIVSSNYLLKLDSIDDEIKTYKSSAQFTYNLIYAIFFLVVSFGIINLMNTAATNMITRKHEFGMMQAIGLSGRQLKNMLNYEGLFYILGTFVITFTVGTGLGYLMCESIRRIWEIDYIDYHFPLLQSLTFIALLFIVQVLVYCFSVNRLKKQSLVERMRVTE